MAGQKKPEIGVIQRALYWGAFASLIAVAVVVLFGVVSASEAGVAVGTLVLVAIIAILGPRGLDAFVRSVREIKVGSVNLRMSEDARKDARVAQAEVLSEGGDDGDDVETGNLVDLRLKLEKKMAYIAKEMLSARSAPPGNATYVTLGSLLEDGFISREQARTLDRLSVMNGEVFALLAERERDEFFAAAQDVVQGLRATVFRAMVTRTLSAPTFESSEVKVGQTQRPVHLCQTGNGLVVIVPVFAVSGSGVNLAKVAGGGALRDVARKASRTIFVVPRNSQALGTPLGDDAEVVTIEDLDARLADLDSVKAPGP